jgi:Zn-dependent M28 family amino/carboxypeptidase
MRSILVTLAAGAALWAAEPGKLATSWWKHVEILADDKMEGRDTGSPGHRMAANYVAQEFERNGLKAAGTDGYLQPVPFQVRRIDEANSSIELIRDGKAEKMQLGREVTIGLRTAPEPKVEAGLVFAGYALVVPEKSFDDLAGLNLKGKIAVLVSGVPAGIPAELAAHYQTERGKRLREAGAIGTITIANPAQMDVPWARASRARLLPSMSLDVPPKPEDGALQIALSWNAEHGEKLFAGSGHTMAELLALSTAKKPLPRFELPVKIRAVQAYEKEKVESQNVVALLPGADAKLKDEIVVLSAHLDHVGKARGFEGDMIHNGAMDNASGVAALLEIARAIKESGAKLKRSVAFVAVTGEEKGLLGSKFYAESPTIQGKMVSELNMDMFLPIHPLRIIKLLGVDESDMGPRFQRIAEKHGVKIQRDPQPERNIFIRSDQYNFVKQGVPSLYPAFGAEPGSAEEKIQKAWLQERYHAVSDDLSQPVDKEGAAKFIEILIEFTREVADAPQAPQWNKESFFRRFVKAGA